MSNLGDKPGFNIFTEPIRAWRAWRVCPDPVAASCGRVIYRLMSLHKWAAWEPRERFAAKCLEHSNLWSFRDGIIMPTYFERYHTAPEESCTCGIYGTKTKDELLSYLETTVFMPAMRDRKPFNEPLLQRMEKISNKASYLAVGTASFYGNVVICETGWRAQYAYPYDITIFTDDERVASAIRERYQIDVRTG